ncbi:trypsin-like peptidase domain-containing protein [Rhodospirillaceae bacterium KN72]|uniref:Trypsin-like peptidase domain-containing protein n=1 Tax=Pacificispira spongiicola TaxID=2729598 RepID=A0A7Y0HEN4_9PROT|nr:S1C family serine protease [Pacificispira spongiicola]NMM45051.1 trypsin-like peptidase domain-containing protein [Pacificispira spongiicola]
MQFLRVSGLRRGAFVLALCGTATLVSACNTTKAVSIPTVQAPESPDLSVSMAETRPFSFAKAISGIRYGTPIIYFPAGGVDGANGIRCNQSHSGESKITWSATSRELSGWSGNVGTVFYDVMSGRGFDLAGNPDQLFNVDDALGRADFQIGARIEEIRGNFCQEHHWYDAHPLDSFSGEMYMRVRWAVYDVLARREVASIETEGYAIHADPESTGIFDVFLDSFGSATEALASNPAFLESIRKQSAAVQEAAAKPLSDDVLVINRVDLSTKPFRDVMPQRLESAVVIDLGNGHGSGFLISEDGYILTNRHVVGERDSVKVRFRNGLTIDGQVIRRHQRRDVALVKVPISGLAPMPLRLEYPLPTDTVYAIGAPVMTDLQSTITKGAVSALRNDKISNDATLPVIQADAAIHGGNSGGPLLDENGNVIGITMYTILDSDGSPTNTLNGFIPIASALEFLQISPTGKPLPNS